MSFYQEHLDLSLRLGDVVEGIVIHTPHLAPLPHAERILEYKVEVDQPSRSVVLVPCCSIGDKSILVAPLRKIIGKFLDNPYSEPDLTRINREMRGMDSVTPADLEKMKQTRREVLVSAKSLYALLERFIYAPNVLLGRYKLKGRDVEHYMIDFRDTHKVKCESVISNEEEATTLFPGKLLQLSIEARKELRLKMVEYFGRIPDEDKDIIVTEKRIVPVGESPFSISNLLMWPDEDSA